MDQCRSHHHRNLARLLDQRKSSRYLQATTEGTQRIQDSRPNQSSYSKRARQSHEPTSSFSCHQHRITICCRTDIRSFPWVLKAPQPTNIGKLASLITVFIAPLNFPYQRYIGIEFLLVSFTFPYVMNASIGYYGSWIGHTLLYAKIVLILTF